MSKTVELAQEKATSRAMMQINRIITGTGKTFKGLTATTPEATASMLSAPFAEVQTIIGHQLAETYLDSYYRECYEIQSNIGMYWRPRKMTTANVNTFLTHKLAGENWRERLQRHYRDYATATATIITTGNRAGIPRREINQLIKRETGRNGDSGLTYKIMRIMRTETNYASNRASASAFKQAGIKRFKVNAVLDDRTCDTCKMYKDGKTYPISTARPGKELPPYHPNCRCFIEYKMSKEAEKKLKRKGTQIKKKLTYNQWYKKYVL